MLKGTGICVYPGIALGRVFVVHTMPSVLPCACGSPDFEKKRFYDALRTAKTQLETLLSQAKATIGEKDAMILDVQLLMLADSDFLSSVDSMIDAGKSAAEAAKASGESFAALFSGLDDPYMKERAADILDLSRRLVRILCHIEQPAFPDAPFIAAAEDLSPSDTIRIPRGHLLALITRGGSVSSHTAILARTLGIPSMVHADLPEQMQSLNGKEMLIDSENGIYWLEPDESTKQHCQEKQVLLQQAQKDRMIYKNRSAVTKKGAHVHVYANIGLPEDVQNALEQGAEGIGLMRSEFLYLGRDSAPCEDELFEAYRTVARAMQGRRVIIRTLDVGADKQLSYLNTESEENPALGMRGIRVCFSQEKLFRTQLRAVYRASAYGSVSLMFPMIASVWEIKKAREICADVRRELEAQGIPFCNIPLGIMIETPAAAILSAELAQEADFFSVGTNDLTQYTLAADRQNAAIGLYADPHHPAVFRLLRMICANAHRAHIPVGICGALGSDFSVTEALIQMGFDEISAAPGRILQLKQIICESEAVSYEGI